MRALARAAKPGGLSTTTSARATSARAATRAAAPSVVVGVRGRQVSGEALSATIPPSPGVGVGLRLKDRRREPKGRKSRNRGRRTPLALVTYSDHPESPDERGSGTAGR